MMSKIWKLLALLLVVGLVLLEPMKSISSSSSETVLLWMGLRVSKHIIPSKQSSNPSLLSALTAWTLSAFVKICREKEKETTGLYQIVLKFSGLILVLPFGYKELTSFL